MRKHFTTEEKASIEAMRAEGYSHREIGEQLGYSKMQIKEYFHRLSKRERGYGVGLDPPKRMGRPRKTPLPPIQEYELCIKELEREVALLRSFLHVAGRR